MTKRNFDYNRIAALVLGRQVLTVILVVGIGIAVSVLLWRLAVSHDSQATSTAFELDAQNHVAALELEIEENLEVMHSLALLYAVQQTVDRQQFRTLAESNLAMHEEIKTLEWIPRVLLAERTANEEAAVQSGFGSFEFTELAGETTLPAAEPEEYYPVYFVEPLQDHEAALGFDLASNPVRLEALERARDTGEQVASGPIQLVQETEEQAGFLVFQAIYEPGAPTGSIQERRDSVAGFVLGVYRAGDVIEHTLSSVDQKAIDIRIVDRTSPTDVIPVFSSIQGMTLREGNAAVVDDTNQHDLSASGSIEVAGRTWQILLTPGLGYVSSNWFESGKVLLTGLAFTTLASLFLVHSLARGSKLQEALDRAEDSETALHSANAQLEERVAQRTAELEQANAGLRDEISAREAAEAQLLHSAKLAAVGQLAADVAHEINNPLGAILGYAQLISEDGALSPATKAQLERIIQRAQGAAKVVRELKEFAAPAKMEKVSNDIHSVIERALSLLEQQIRLDDIAVVRNYGSGFPAIEYDPDRIEQVLVNLILNAKDAMPDGGTLTISTEVAGDGQDVAIIVSDTGVGIASEDHGRLFEPFYTAGKAKGTGLGLSISQRIVEDHGGRIQVESEPGQGSRFTVWLPASAPEQVSQQAVA